MRFTNHLPGAARLSAALLAVGMTLGMAGDALAWSRFHDHIYADSFGNLVIQSPNGYKRIVVGQGHLAKQLSKYETAGNEDDDVVYYDDNGGDNADSYDGGDYVERDCYRPPYSWKGRSYMYGLPDGVVPQAPCVED